MTAYHSYVVTYCDICGMSENFCIAHRNGFYHKNDMPLQAYKSITGYPIFLEPIPPYAATHDLCGICREKVLKSEAMHDGVLELTDIIGMRCHGRKC